MINNFVNALYECKAFHKDEIIEIEYIDEVGKLIKNIAIVFAYYFEIILTKS